MRRRRFLGAVPLGLILPLAGRASLQAQDAAKKEEPATPEVDDRVVGVLKAARTGGRRLPGMIGAIVRGEEVEAIGADGVRRVGSPRPIRVDDVVHIGSCTKAMTAAMIGTLVDEGRLRWGSTIAEVFPDRAEGIHPGFQATTLAQLMAHRAGLPRDIPWHLLAPGRSPTDQRLDLLSRMLADPPRARPGSAFDYSNLGYVLAGLMAEQVTQTPWELLMRRRVFGPLKMASAGFGPPGAPGRDDQPSGHRVVGGLVVPVRGDNPPAMGPAGTVHCSVLDWARFAMLQLRGSVGGARPLSPATLRSLQTPARGEEYVGGWMVGDRSWAGGRTLSHNGSNTLWYCTIWIAPARDLAFLVATNAGGDEAPAACDEAVQGLIRLAPPDGLSRGR